MLRISISWWCLLWWALLDGSTWLSHNLLRCGLNCIACIIFRSCGATSVEIMIYIMVYLPSRRQKGCCQIHLCHHHISQQCHCHGHDLGDPLWHPDSHDTLPSCSWQGKLFQLLQGAGNEVNVMHKHWNVGQTYLECLEMHCVWHAMQMNLLGVIPDIFLRNLINHCVVVWCVVQHKHHNLA